MCMESEARKSLLSGGIITLERIDSTKDSEVAEMDIDSYPYRSCGSGEISAENEHELEQEDNEVRNCQLY